MNAMPRYSDRHVLDLEQAMRSLAKRSEEQISALIAQNSENLRGTAARLAADRDRLQAVTAERDALAADKARLIIEIDGHSDESLARCEGERDILKSIIDIIIERTF